MCGFVFVIWIVLFLYFRRVITRRATLRQWRFQSNPRRTASSGAHSCDETGVSASTIALTVSPTGHNWTEHTLIYIFYSSSLVFLLLIFDLWIIRGKKFMSYLRLYQSSRDTCGSDCCGLCCILTVWLEPWSLVHFWRLSPGETLKEIKSFLRTYVIFFTDCWWWSLIYLILS